MYGEIKGRLYVRIPEGSDPDEVLRLEVLDPPLAAERHQGKVVLAKRSAIQPMSVKEYGSLAEGDVLGVEQLS